MEVMKHQYMRIIDAIRRHARTADSLHREVAIVIVGLP